MPLPDSSTTATYGMPSGGWANGGPVVNPQTDRDATTASKESNDVAGMTRIVLRAWCRFITVASGPVGVTDYEAVWGGVQPPPAAPTVTRVTTGIYAVTWPSIVGDEMNNAAGHVVSFRKASGFIDGPPTSTPMFVQCAFPSANTVNVYVWTISAGLVQLLDAAGTNVRVELG